MRRDELRSRGHHYRAARQLAPRGSLISNSLGDTECVLHRLADVYSESMHPAAAEARNAFVAAQSHTAALAVELGPDGDLSSAVHAALDGFRHAVNGPP